MIWVCTDENQQFLPGKCLRPPLETFHTPQNIKMNIKKLMEDASNRPMFTDCNITPVTIKKKKKSNLTTNLGTKKKDFKLSI